MPYDFTISPDILVNCPDKLELKPSEHCHPCHRNCAPTSQGQPHLDPWIGFWLNLLTYGCNSITLKPNSSLRSSG
ncbi:MAG: hypothetical protein WCA35_01340 [Kovacikia sp.]